MATTLAEAETASKLPSDSTAVSENADSATRLLGKGSIPLTPKSSTTPEYVPPSSRVTADVKPREEKPAERKPRARTSALPVMTKTTTKIGVPGPKLRPGVNGVAQKRQLEKQLAIKRQRYLALGKELAEKQKQARELYDDLAELRDKAVAVGLEAPGMVGSLAVPGVKSEFVDTLEIKLNEMTDPYRELCRRALLERTKMTDWIANFSRENGDKLGPAIAGHLEDLVAEDAGFRFRLDEASGKQRAIMDELMREASSLRGERENRGIHSGELEKLAEERRRKSIAEAHLQKAKMRIRELEDRAIGAENRLQQTVESLELQLRQKETMLEGRTKEMNRAVKNSKDLLARTEKQRDSLESRVTELTRKIDSKGAELNGAVEKLTARLEDAEKMLAAERDLRSQAEGKANELAERCAILEEKSKQLCDLSESAKGFAVNSEGKHTAGELQLWNELQSTRSALATQEETLLEANREKERIFSVLRRAADQNDPSRVNDELAAELLARSEELRAVMEERAQLQRNLKTAIDKSDVFERQLSELHCRLHARAKEGGKSGWSAHAIELEQRLSDLQATLAELTRRNEQLEAELTEKQLELEQRDRVMRELRKVLKVRDELIGLLKEQNPRGNGEAAGSEDANLGRRAQLDPESIDRLIAAKSEDLEVLYRTLEGKQMQLTRLERVVRQMEDENERSQATRTKLEREVAQLRLQLHEKNRERRKTGFIFV